MSLLARVNPQFVSVPGGVFPMGSMQWGYAQPVSSVEISSFEMMDAPVTVEQFKAYIEWGEENNISHGRFIYGSDGRIAQTIWGSSKKALLKKTVTLNAGHFMSDIRRLVPTWREYRGRFDDITEGARRFLDGDKPETGNKPAVMIDWWEAAGFCAAIGCELPTEAQHEYAARAGRKGDDVYGTDSAKLTAENARWDHDGSVNETADIRSYPPNPLGLHDMAGNVWEWCSNWFSANYNGWALKDPAGPLVGGVRAVRGGSWYNDNGYDLLAAYRHSARQDGRDRNLGFRAVRRSAS